MPGRHWVIAFNEQTDECRFLKLVEEWLPFKYDEMDDIEPDWEQLGLYETIESAYRGFIEYSSNNRSIGR